MTNKDLNERWDLQKIKSHPFYENINFSYLFQKLYIAPSIDIDPHGTDLNKIKNQKNTDFID